MFVRALLAFLALPGIVAFAIPIVWVLLSAGATLVQPLGLVPLVAGTVALLTIAPELERFLAKRMNARTIELDAGHLSLVSHPREIADLILEAAGRGG